MGPVLEAERRAAYEAGQTRRAMDGLRAKRELQERRNEGPVSVLARFNVKESAMLVPHWIVTLPALGVLVRESGEKVCKQKVYRREVQGALARRR